MRRPAALALLASIAGCHPAAGDVYEAKRTRERVEVLEVGACPAMDEHAHAHHRSEVEVIRSMVDAGARLGSRARPPAYRPSGAPGAERCAAVAAVAAGVTDAPPGEGVAAYRWPEWIGAVPLGTLREDYVRVR